MKTQAVEFSLRVDINCPYCAQRHSLQADLVDGMDHRCSCCSQMFKLPRFAVLEDLFNRLRDGRAVKSQTKIKGRKK